MSDGKDYGEAQPAAATAAGFSKEIKLNAVKLLKAGQKPGTQIALELGIRRNQLYKWAAELDEKSGDTTAAFNGSGRKPIAQQSELERLKRELAQVTEERDILIKGGSILCQTTAVKYAFVREHAKLHSVAALCRGRRLSRSNYYDWFKQSCSARSRQDACLLEQIQRVHIANRGAYGALMTWKQLRTDGVDCGPRQAQHVLQTRSNWSSEVSQTPGSG